jgi:hypothetical protein
MRTIQISTAAFAKIWAHRVDGEEDENTILERLLGVESSQQDSPQKPVRNLRFSEKTLWRHDVKTALTALGGEAHLKQIYTEVRDIRRKAGRSLPLNLEAIVRRELEYNSSDSNVHTGKFDWFRSVGGLGSGVWALRIKDRLA